jgi:hypothetical protein
MLSTAIPQPTEWQHVADQIDAAMIFTWVDFVNYIGSGVVRESEVLHRTIRSYASFLSRDSCEAGQVAIGKTGVVAFFNALTKSNKISTLVSEKHFNPRAKSEVFRGRCRAQTKAPPVLFYPPYYLSNSRSCANFQGSPFR